MIDVLYDSGATSSSSSRALIIEKTKTKNKPAVLILPGRPKRDVDTSMYEMIHDGVSAQDDGA